MDKLVSMLNENSTMTQNAIVEKIILHQFEDNHLLTEALEAAGAHKHSDTKSEKDEGNKRLAMIGDALIRLAILDDWYPNGATIGKLVRCQYINSMI